MADNDKPSSDDYARAKRLADELLAPVTGDKPTADARSEITCYLADVEADVEAFSTLYRHAEGRPMLCLRFGMEEIVPVDLARAMPVLLDGWDVEVSDRTPAAYVKLTGSGYLKPTAEGMKFETHSRGDALDMFRSKLVDFLAVRLKAAAPACSPGLQITVHTKHKGQRVDYAPCYFLSSRSVFGSPTTPVKAWIQPGKYRFAACAHGHTLWDTGHYAIPPTTSARLLV